LKKSRQRAVGIDILAFDLEFELGSSVQPWEGAVSASSRWKAVSSAPSWVTRSSLIGLQRLVVALDALVGWLSRRHFAAFSTRP